MFIVKVEWGNNHVPRQMNLGRETFSEALTTGNEILIEYKHSKPKSIEILEDDKLIASLRTL